MTRFKPSMFRLAACALLAASLGVAPAAAQDLGLNIRVLEGDGAVNIIGQATAVRTLVEVRDRNDLPVAGVSVLFLLGDGGTATLNENLQQFQMTTNAQGQAAVTVNPVATGEIELSVRAEYLGETVETTIVQTNFQTVAEALAAGATVPPGAAAGAGAAGGLGTGAIVGVAAAGGGVAAACAAGLCGGDGTPPPPPPPVVPQVSAPSRPSAPTLTAGDRQLRVSWVEPATNGAQIVDYDVRYREVGVSRWEYRPDTMNSTARMDVIPNLTNGTEYEVQVLAENSAGRERVVTERTGYAGGAGQGTGAALGADGDAGRRRAGGELD